MQADEQFFSKKREQLVNLLARGYQPIRDERVLNAMRKVKRELFVPNAYKQQAYDNNPLPIGQGQTISQPYIIADMLEQLKLKGDELILEIGTGSGYQTALLCELAKFVFSIERIDELAKSAETALTESGCENFFIVLSDGSIGLKPLPISAFIETATQESKYENTSENGNKNEHENNREKTIEKLEQLKSNLSEKQLESLAPFDAIIVSAEMPTFPQSLFSMLAENGRRAPV